MRVLHVVEALGGGVTSAMREYVHATQPDAEHVVVARLRDGHRTGEDVGAPMIAQLPPVWNGPGAVRVIAAAVRRFRPHVVHAHSSFGGGFARITPTVPTGRLVYTPHCYAFERTDLSPLKRRALRRAERLLAPRTGAVAAVSPREADLARELGVARVVHVPQVVSLPEGMRAARVRAPGEPGPRYVTAGRICPQKDPAFFLATARELLRSQPDAEITWLGGGEPADEEALRAVGVRVTGWIPRERLLAQMASADVYVHTAAWEGSPMTVLEAAGLGLPVVARRIPALTSLGMHPLADTPAQLASAAETAYKDPGSAVVGLDIEGVHNRTAQRAALLGLYHDISERYPR